MVRCAFGTHSHFHATLPATAAGPAASAAHYKQRFWLSTVTGSLRVVVASGTAAQQIESLGHSEPQVAPSDAPRSIHL